MIFWQWFLATGHFDVCYLTIWVRDTDICYKAMNHDVPLSLSYYDFLHQIAVKFYHWIYQLMKCSLNLYICSQENLELLENCYNIRLMFVFQRPSEDLMSSSPVVTNGTGLSPQHMSNAGDNEAKKVRQLYCQSSM